MTRKLGAPPEKIDPLTGAMISSSFSPSGFSSAMLPMLYVLGDRQTLQTLQALLQRDHAKALRGTPTNYYDQTLILFGQGWLQKHYRFDATGRLHPAWTL